MDRTSIPGEGISPTSTTKSGRKKGATKHQTRKGASLTSTGTTRSERLAEHESTIPLMMRPKISQKECVERIAVQIGMKRSQLDPTFYLTGALLTGIERLSKTEQIGTWSRKEVAVHLKSAFTPLFELLYEQDELPLVFSLLLSRGDLLSFSQSPGQNMELQQQVLATETGMKTHTLEHQHPPQEVKIAEADPYLSLLSTDAEIGLDGFPGGI